MFIIEPAEDMWGGWHVGYVHFGVVIEYVYCKDDYWHVDQRYSELKEQLYPMTLEEFREALCS